MEKRHIEPEWRVGKRFAWSGKASPFMFIEQIIVVALIQGITEFLPISSSGHLILVPLLTGWADQGVMTDVMVHMGSFLAVVVYFWRDILRLITGVFELLARHANPWGRLALYIVAGTIPAVAMGIVLDKIGFMDAVRGMPEIVAWNAIVFGVLLYVCDRFGLWTKTVEDMTLGQALVIGVAQAIAIIPGTSRSGITMTAGRALGFERPEAARFSFLLGIPAIAGAGVLKLGEAVRSGAHISGDQLLTAFLTFLVALATIAVLMHIVKHTSFLPFAIYRVILGIALLAVIYAGVPLGSVQ
jgi:undecaprenyl-diphosphatase